MKYIVANWKSYKTEKDCLLWLDIFLEKYVYREGVQVLIAPPSLGLSRMAEKIKDSGVSGLGLVAQNVSAFPSGGYTGELSADLVKPFTSYAIVGHSERRKYFRETNNDITNKVTELADADMVPILCLDDDTLSSQLAAIVDVECSQILLAYTPQYALNSNIAEPVDIVEKSAKDMRGYLPKAKIIYGGAVRADNVQLYWSAEGVDGVFVGKASHQVDDFLKIVDLCTP